MTVCFVSVYETLWGANLSQKKKDEIFQQMFRRIEGSYSEEDGQERDPSFFPNVHSNDESVSGHDFLEGTLLLPFLEQCPLMMAPLLASLRATPSHSRSQLAQESVLMGYVDGDGSFSALFNGEADPTLSIAMKDSQRHIDHGDDPNAYKEYLVQNVPGISPSSTSAGQVVRKLNRDSLCKSLFFLAGTLCLTIKAQQFYVICILAWPLQLFSHSCIGICFTSFVEVCRKMTARVLSGVNTAHGVGIGEAFYNHRFRAMVESPIRCIFQYHGAGMMGSDGYIRPDRVNLCQSNEEYCNAFASTCTSALGFQRPRVNYGSMNRKSLNTRSVWYVEFSGEDQVLAAVHFGSFDYNRRTQWLVMVIIKLIQKSNLPNKGAIVEFLGEFLSYIKRVRES
jgi:hypothetical protein